MCLALSGVAYSQSTEEFVHWQHSIGGSGEDALSDMVTDASGNLFVVGSVQSSSNQSMDILVSGFAESGRELWSVTLGDLGDDHGISIELLNNQLYILASSNSKSGLFSENSGREDIYLFRFTLDGALIGQTHFAGNYSDIPTEITKTKNGELLISAHSLSDNGFFDTNKGQTDMWVIRVNAIGELIWKKNLGGMEEDFSVSIEETKNGELIIFGHSSSYDGDIGVNYGDFDLSLFKLNSAGNILWEQNYGGLQAEIGVDLIIKNDGHLFLAGNTLSSSLDIQKNAGFSDAWVLEVNDLNGEIIWEQTHGGPESDYAASLAFNAKGELFLMGLTNAPVFMGDAIRGKQNVWLAQINSPNTIEHIAVFGGNEYDAVSKFIIHEGGSITLIGTSNSTNDLFSDNKGKGDGWLMKVELTRTTSEAATVSAHPNPSNGLVYLNNLSATDEIRVHNSMGQLVLAPYQVTGISERIDLTSFLPGVYLIHIQRESSSELIRLVRN